MYEDSHIKTISELKTYLENPCIAHITLSCNKKDRADWIHSCLIRFKYSRCSKKEKWIIVQYVRYITGLSREQIKRHIRAYKKWTRLCTSYKRNTFSQKYTLTDEALLAEVDNATGRISWALTLALIKEEYLRGDLRFERLFHISVAGIYRLRGKKYYIEKALHVSHTHATNIPIWVRKKPRPNGKPGYIRVDTVHQGDVKDVGKNKEYTKWVYHVNLVDEVTQWEVVFAVPEISETFLLPLLEKALHAFPFKIINFHSDNGSEYINYQVAKMLEKLRISQSKSRARKSNDNWLVESKNAAIIRKEFGHWHIPQVFAEKINCFYQKYFIPYLNFHRPCHFPEKEILENGKIKIHYLKENCMTPYKKLCSIPNWKKYLCANITPESLEKIFLQKTPLQAAKDKKKARDELLKIVLPKYSNTIET